MTRIALRVISLPLVTLATWLVGLYGLIRRFVKGV